MIIISRISKLIKFHLHVGLGRSAMPVKGRTDFLEAMKDHMYDFHLRV